MKAVGLIGLFGKPLPQHLDSDDFAGVLMRRSVHARKGAGANQIQDLVIPVKEAVPIAAEQAFGLVIGQKLSPQQKLLELLGRKLASANLAPHVLKLTLIQQIQVES